MANATGGARPPAPQYSSKPKPKKIAKKAPGSGNDPVTKALKFFLGDKSNPNVTKKQGTKNAMPSRRGSIKDKPVQILPKRPGTQSPKVPIPSGPMRPGGATSKNKPRPAGPKKKSPGVVITPKPKKKPTLDDFLLKGKRPPLAPGQKKLPSDSDVILKNYNKKK